MSRLLLSYFANVYARIVTGLPLADATGGYKCFRREVLEALALDKVESNGYAFQIEMSFRAWKKGFRLREIPIMFVDRDIGESKMSKKIVREAVWRVWRLRWLAARGFDPGRHRLRLLRGTWVPTLLDVVSPTGATWNGNNASTWRSVVVKANGFEHELGYGGQDREFGERIANLGVVGKLVRHRAVAVHLDHGRPYRTPESIRGNREMREAVRRTGRVRALHGIEQLETE